VKKVKSEKVLLKFAQLAFSLFHFFTFSLYQQFQNINRKQAKDSGGAKSLNSFKTWKKSQGDLKDYA
jgi:hypothetical protein